MKLDIHTYIHKGTPQVENSKLTVSEISVSKSFLNGLNKTLVYLESLGLSS